MKLSNTSTRQLKTVFDQYSTDDNFGFNKTVVPVRLAALGTDSFVSRSQAKRLLSRIDKFEVALFDFEGVSSIGQAFADEIFRVFAKQHPEIEMRTMNTTEEVDAMIERVRNSNIDT